MPTDLSRRIADLSQEKRELLQKLLVRERRDAGGSLPLPSVSRASSPADQASEVASIRVDLAGPAPAALRITRQAISRPEGEAKQLYELVNRNLDQGPFAAHSVFLNLGYVANQNPLFSPVRLPRHCLNRNCIQLALEVIADVELNGCDVADVGCGRGGTIAVMNTYFSPRLIVGVDFSRSAIAFCKRTHRFQNACFVEGDAQDMPLSSGRFDVLTSIESASGYPDIERFYREVVRLLRRGGCFLYADVVSNVRLSEQRALLSGLGLVIERERDITSNVMLSCDETGRVHRAALGEGHEEEVVGSFLSLPDSRIYQQMKRGELVYRIYKARKAAA